MSKSERFYWVRYVTANESTDGRTWRIKRNAIRRAKAMVKTCPELRIAHVMVNDPWGGASVAEFTGKSWPTGGAK